MNKIKIFRRKSGWGLLYLMYLGFRLCRLKGLGIFDSVRKPAFLLPVS